MIKIVCVGKNKKYDEEIKTYLKQFPFKVEVIEVKDESLKENIVKEEIRILSKIPKNAYVILLAIEGKMYDSVAFSKKTINLLEEKKELYFIIGGSYGVTNNIYERADELISFSKMTFPHQLMRLMFVEQLYRAVKINENHPYHK